MRKVFILSFIYMSFSFNTMAQLMSATDGLGRKLPQQEDVGQPKTNRHVVMFYFLWQGDPTTPTSERAWDLSELWQKHREVFDDFDNPQWGGGAGIAGRYYFWGQSIYGYYNGNDYWVHLKNLQLLTDAGVDILALDATNALVYPTQSHAVFRALASLRIQGKNPPKVVYYTNSASGKTMQTIFDTYYKVGASIRYPDSWYIMDGKPLIIGIGEEAIGKDFENFFTLRQSQWPNEPKKVDGWPWIDFKRPQIVYQNHKGENEIVNVSTAQHPNLGESMGGSAFHGAIGNWGRSYHNGGPGEPVRDLFYGYNIQEQWDFALKQNVPYVFITGWNEWIAGKWRRNDKKKNEALFVDQANAEYSRDIEPSNTSDLQDHYYMQLVANIRRYKGVEARPAFDQVISIKKLTDWKMVKNKYTDYTGDVIHRNFKGAQSEPVVIYSNTTGRNDFDSMKVASDNNQVYFYVKTVSPITKPEGDNWMRLYLDTDRSHLSGWTGYDHRVIYGNQLQKYTEGQWVNVAKLKNKVLGNEMMITIPMKLLELSSKRLNLEFKWSDNMQNEDALDWYINGDTAPGGRFNFVATNVHN